MNDLISVIIPVYNSDKYIEKCLNSILCQSYKFLEIIIINDGSTDKSHEICQKFIKKYKNIKYISQENNGVSNARNRGIKEATGKYIAFIDSDDTIPQNYFEVLINNLINNAADLSIVSILDSNGNESVSVDMIVDFENSDNRTKIDFFELNKLFLLYPPYAKLYRSKIIKKYKIEFPKKISYGEDLIFNCNYLMKTNRITYSNKSTYYYCRDNNNSLSQKFRNDRFANELILCDELKKLFIEKNVFDENYKKYLEDRIFDEGYNSIFDIMNLNISYKQKKLMIENIINDAHYIESSRYVSKNKYSKIILWLIIKKHIIVLILYYKIRSK